MFIFVEMKMNFFEEYNWTTLNVQGEGTSLEDAPRGKATIAFTEREKIISLYHNILCPKNDYPYFLDKYIALPIMQRLAGIGLLCGSDWTKLFNNRFYYSRLDHSKGVALIVWHFTHSKAQTLAGLFHDVSTPVFSHVSDFRKGDALTQTATEAPTATMLRADKTLNALLAKDGLTVAQVEDYHIYPVADNEIPRLSADRLEYMFPSGMALDGSWTMEEIHRCYGDITILKNEDGADELGFCTKETAELYCERFCMIGHILQLNEDKMTLHLLGAVMNIAEKLGVLTESDFMSLSEREVIEKLEFALNSHTARQIGTGGAGITVFGLENSEEFTRLSRLYKTFRLMTEIAHTDTPLPEEEWFCVNLKVKQRYINPLVKVAGNIEGGNAQRLSEVSEKSRKIIEDFKAYSDTAYGCVKLL